MAARQPWAGVHVRATVAWLDWFGRLARHVGATTPGLIDRALASFAESVGFEPPPARQHRRRQATTTKD